MTNSPSKKRTDSASKVIQASPQAIYNAFVNPVALVSWLPPKGMKGHFYEFEAKAGGVYRMSLTYLEPDQSTQGKTSENTDVVKGRFLEFSLNERVVQLVEFESDDAAFSGEMILTWELADTAEGTLVTIVCENVPEGVGKEDHEEGLKSTLENLASYTEGAL